MFEFNAGVNSVHVLKCYARARSYTQTRSHAVLILSVDHSP